MSKWYSAPPQKVGQKKRSQKQPQIGQSWLYGAKTKNDRYQKVFGLIRWSKKYSDKNSPKKLFAVLQTIVAENLFRKPCFQAPWRLNIGASRI